MRARGVEPPRAQAHRDLNPTRLPVPPRPRAAKGSPGTGGSHWHDGRVARAEQPPLASPEADDATAGRDGTRSRVAGALLRIELPLACWLALAAVLALITTRVRDWYVMTDEMRYERLALSIARTHSLVPRIHGVDVHSFS